MKPVRDRMLSLQKRIIRFTRCPIILKRKRLLVVCLAAAFVALAIWVEPTRVVWGWLRGEAFYQGRPTSYWRREIGQWRIEFVADTPGPMYRREQSSFERLLSYWVTIPDKPWPALLDGDRGGALVLQELLEDSPEFVRDWARVGFHRLTEGSRGPWKTLKR